MSNAKRNFSGDNLIFEKSEHVDDLKKFPDTRFQISVAMETMEHLPPDSVGAYLAEIERITGNYFIVTVPNEKGIVFLLKYIVKSIFLEGNQKYSWSELFDATFGRLHKIDQDDHKGFDYDELIGQISREFDVVRTEPIPFTALPRWAGFTVGIIAKKRSPKVQS